MRIDTYKDKIKTGLINKQPRITVSYYNAQALFKIVLSENPSLAAVVSGYSFEPLIVGGVFNVEYGEKTAAAVDMSRADTAGQVEEILHRSIRKYRDMAEVSVAMGVDIAKAYNDFIVAYQGFYSNLVSTGYSEQIRVGSPRKTVIFTFKYRIGRVKLTMMETEVNKKVEELGRTLFCGGMSDQTKAFIAHNYLAQTVYYWHDENAKPLEESYMQSAYGALINHKCVCQGYAEAYKRILDAQDITCEVICGKVKGSPNYHAWNVISFNNREYYHVDVTWDAHQPGAERYRYYGLTDAELAPDRIWTRTSNIICNGRDRILDTARQQIARSGNEFALKGADKKYFN